ncbi:hypothetical protein B9J93_19960 [Vibrio sp. V17_P4S1T151]|uniref:hypothetical protein n=1 Tax=unclassified Vibrio TaxID=2614977 RepID=UPI000B8EC56C|nr:MULTISPECIES: hypothetical protein [unclassified Vibrio]OXX41420.1 hypothetical protein B9J93_19960 [Vibrio sp. V17_P4S1T151]OXX65044.1 hypothetical protein B9J89_03955 [Vibrio sp. V15_P4S5T153]
MNNEDFFNQLMNFSTTPDTIFSLCGITLVAGFVYVLLKVMIMLFSNFSKTPESLEESNAKFPSVWMPIQSVFLMQLIIGAMKFSGQDERYTTIGNVFGTAVQSYQVAGLFITVVIICFAISLVSDVKTLFQSNKNEKRA